MDADLTECVLKIALASVQDIETQSCIGIKTWSQLIDYLLVVMCYVFPAF